MTDDPDCCACTDEFSGDRASEEAGGSEDHSIEHGVLRPERQLSVALSSSVSAEGGGFEPPRAVKPNTDSSRAP